MAAGYRIREGRPGLSGIIDVPGIELADTLIDIRMSPLLHARFRISLMNCCIGVTVGGFFTLCLQINPIVHDRRRITLTDEIKGLFAVSCG